MPGVDLRQSYGCAGCAQVDRPEKPLDTLHHCDVGAVVGSESQDLVGPGARHGVGLDITATEAVDSLFRVTDQHHRGAAVEACLKELPLLRVGVLELVHQDHPEPAAQQLSGGRPGVRVGERRRQPPDHVVVAQDAQQPLAAVDLRPDGGGESDP